jgi:ankyrin repeat protein
MLAVKYGKDDLVELLLNNCASVNLQDSDGSTALIYAVEHGSLNIVKLLLARSECDVNIVNNVRKFFNDLCIRIFILRMVKQLLVLQQIKIEKIFL